MFCVLHLGICLSLGYPFSAILWLIQVSAAEAFRPNTLFHILHSPISAFQGSYLPTMAYRPHAGFKTCVIGYGDSTLNTTRGRSSVVLLAEGFGASGGNDRPIFEAPGSALAKAALESSGGDLDRATSVVFQQRLAKLQEEDAELGGRIRDLSAAGRTLPTAAIENEALHEALVSATWDAVAVMNALPKSRKTSADEREEKRIAKRLKSIADAVRRRARTGGDGGAGVSEGCGCKVLDIGCGDGTLMPYLLQQPGKQKKKSKMRTKKAVKGGKADETSEQAEAEASPQATFVLQEADVTGVDLSEVMISAATQKYPKARWLTGNALYLPSLLGMDRPEPLFSSVVFNGSLQFFRDPPKALSDAAEWLVDGGHIVVAHVQGSDFVRDECKRNRLVAPSPMPGREGMEEWAFKAGCSLLPGPDDLSQREFLLHVMAKL
ncbi:unnamed protein product [Ascophyllum nodosum]